MKRDTSLRKEPSLQISEYEILAEIGHGGFGVVYRGRDRVIGREVALKKLECINPATLQRFKREFRSLANVTHPNLVTLHKLISESGVWFLTMDLVEGVDFMQFVRDRADISASETGLPATTAGETADVHAVVGPHPTGLNHSQMERLRCAFGQLITGVCALHDHGILHRDLKPSNIQVTPTERVVLLDFGLAAEIGDEGVYETADQQMLGTIPYMAPEQAASGSLSPASDWYAVGNILFEALTGTLPFQGSPLEILTQKVNDDAPKPSDLVQNIPDDLDQLCFDLLQRDPHRRPGGNEILDRANSPRRKAVASHCLRRRERQGPATIIGRDPQLKILNDGLVVSKRGKATSIFISGMSGTGKSALVKHFLDSVNDPTQIVVLGGRCYERESVPFKAVDSLIDALCDYLRHLPEAEAALRMPRDVDALVRVFPVLRRVKVLSSVSEQENSGTDEQELRRRAFGALRELLVRITDRSPLVLVIDDLQWGDADSAALIFELLQPPGEPPLLFLGCYRSNESESSPFLSTLADLQKKSGRELDRRDISLEPLDQDHAFRLAKDLLEENGDVDGHARVIASESDGNPFFLRELATHVKLRQYRSGSITRDKLTLDEVLWSRIQTLSPDARVLLELVAVAGSPVEVDVLNRAANAAGSNPVSLSQLANDNLVRTFGMAAAKKIDTYHDRVRETILSHVCPETSRAHHLHIALALEEASDVSADELLTLAKQLNAHDTQAESKHAIAQVSEVVYDLAYHFDAAGQSDRAFPYAFAAAQQARSQYSLESAETQFTIAQRGAVHVDDDTQFQIAESLADIQTLRGRYEQAEHQLQSALALAEGNSSRARIEGKQGDLHFKKGDMVAASRCLENAIQLLGGSLPSGPISTSLFLLRESCTQILHSLIPRWFLGRLPLSSATRDVTMIRLYRRLAYPYFFARSRWHCLCVQLRAMNLAERFPVTAELAATYSDHAAVVSTIPLFSRAYDYANRSLDIRRDIGDVWGQAQSLHFYGVALHSAARFDECIDKCRQAIELFEQVGDYWEINIARFLVAMSLCRLGRMREAADIAVETYESGVELGDVQSTAMSLEPWARASCETLSMELVERELDRPRQDFLATANVALALALCLLAEGRHTEAVVVLERAASAISNSGVTNAWVTPVYSWLAIALRLEAEQHPSGSKEQAELLKRGLAFARKGVRVSRKFPAELPNALRAMAFIHARRGNKRRAFRLLEEALATAKLQNAQREYAQLLLDTCELREAFGMPDTPMQRAQAQELMSSLDNQLGT